MDKVHFQSKKFKKIKKEHLKSKVSVRKLLHFYNIIKQAEEKTSKMKIQNTNIKDELLINTASSQQESLENLGLTYSIMSIKNLKSLEQSRQYMDKIFNLTKENMEHIYNKCNYMDIGWDNKTKQNELSQKGAHYLIINSKSEYNSDTPDRIVAFLQFMYLLDEDHEKLETVCYILELQIHKLYQSYGLGKLMIDLIEGISRKMRLHKILCTVQTSNPRALKFYIMKCSFTEDESNPAFPCHGDLMSNIDKLGSYVILKKTLDHENITCENLDL